ncbi:unnamed protein product [Pleuronectes platessa]|uniref:Uncharacterized protein n=1 Tax=Pleuronectes platessa TaxID=8262 RepID=A0A9N7U4D3_PLEPL|nr:unnamed protein product [Pleuronectes platessa]
MRTPRGEDWNYSSQTRFFVHCHASLNCPPQIQNQNSWLGHILQSSEFQERLELVAPRGPQKRSCGPLGSAVEELWPLGSAVEELWPLGVSSRGAVAPGVSSRGAVAPWGQQ